MLISGPGGTISSLDAVRRLATEVSFASPMIRKEFRNAVAGKGTGQEGARLYRHQAQRTACPRSVHLPEKACRNPLKSCMTPLR